MADSFEWTEYLDQLKKILWFDLNDDHIFFLNQYARYLSKETEIIFYKRGLHLDQKKLVSLQSSENVLELRHRFGNYLYIPIEISSSVSIYHGHTPIPLAGSGAKEPWEKIIGVWNKKDSIQTWIS